MSRVQLGDRQLLEVIVTKVSCLKSLEVEDEKFVHCKKTQHWPERRPCSLP